MLIQHTAKAEIVEREVSGAPEFFISHIDNNIGNDPATDTTNWGHLTFTIPAQVQADWNENDGTSKAFIKNKPTTITSSERTKLQGIATGAEVNVKSDWNETSSSEDSYIDNKPTVHKIQPLSTTETAFSRGDVVWQVRNSVFELYLLKIDQTTSASGVSSAPENHSNRWELINGGSGDTNVQSDWNVTDTTSDAFIKNKPQIITTAERSKLSNVPVNTISSINAKLDKTAFVKSVVPSGNDISVTTVDINGDESTSTITVSGGGGGGSGNGVHFGAVDPADTLGENGDVYFNTDTGEIHQKTSGSWVEVLDLVTTAELTAQVTTLTTSISQKADTTTVTALMNTVQNLQNRRIFTSEEAHQLDLIWNALAKTHTSIALWRGTFEVGDHLNNEGFSMDSTASEGNFGTKVDVPVVDVSLLVDHISAQGVLRNIDASFWTKATDNFFTFGWQGASDVNAVTSNSFFSDARVAIIELGTTGSVLYDARLNDFQVSADAIAKSETDTSLTALRALTNGEQYQMVFYRKATAGTFDELKREVIEVPLYEVAKDNTLTGKGTTADPLKVANPITAEQLTKIMNSPNTVVENVSYEESTKTLTFTKKTNLNGTATEEELEVVVGGGTPSPSPSPSGGSSGGSIEDLGQFTHSGVSTGQYRELNGTMSRTLTEDDDFKLLLVEVWNNDNVSTDDEKLEVRKKQPICW